MAKVSKTGRKGATPQTPPDPGRPRIGAQIKTAGGFFLVPQRAVDIGAEVVQIFDSNSRQWRPKPYDPEEVAALRAGLDEHDLALFFHAIYLINLATPDDELRAKSAEALAEALFMGAVTGGEGIVLHVGSHKGEGFKRACLWVERAMATARELAYQHLAGIGLDGLPLPDLLLETTAGAVHSMGRDLGQLEVLIKEIPGCALCIDTAHLFAAGTPIHTEEGLEAFVDELRSRGLLERLKLIHLNDSHTVFASGHDHHENLGDGKIGYESLGRVVRHPAFQEIAFVLEIPGLDGHGPDAVNMERAKSMRAGAPVPPKRPARSA